jgi:hypothetical protein
MWKNTGFILYILLLLCSTPLFALDDEFWVCPSFETANYNPEGLAYGTGLTLAYGRGVSLGLKAAYFFNTEETTAILEVTALLRLYLLNLKNGGAIKGPWLQFNGGPALYYRENITDGNNGMGNLSAGLGFGWRFLLGNYFFAEPYIKGGYPFIFGGGFAVGYHYGEKNEK